MLPKFSLLFFGEALLIIGLTFEWQRIKRILRVLLVEYVAVTVPPIWETLHIRRLSKYWLSFIVVFFKLLFLRNNLKILIGLPRCGTHVHLVRIDYFCLLFEIERFAVFQNDCLFKFVAEVLLISRCQRSRIRIPYKFISAPCLSPTLIPLKRRTLNCVRFVHTLRNTKRSWSIGLVTVPRSKSLFRK